MAVRGTQDLAFVGGGLVAGVVATLWAGGTASALICGHAVPRGHPWAALTAFDHLADPSVAWHSPVGPPIVYWPTTSVTVAIAVGLGILARRVWLSIGTGADGRGERADGFAARTAVRRAAGSRALVRKGRTLRPSMTSATASDVGFRLGRSSGVQCWASVEDSLVVLGPPRSGKGLHLVIPAILDAPGAVVTTSTRPDDLAVTIRARGRIGPVAVFDPQGLAGSTPETMRWSPIRGCEEAGVAMARARALCAESASGVENGSFWTHQCQIAVRCLLHAAALDGRPPVELYRWSLSPLAAEDAADILRSYPRAAPAWSTALTAILTTDPRQRDSIWAMVSNTFAALADPSVLDAVSPRGGETFDPVTFLGSRGTLYLLGTASGASATARLVSALIEDVVETARHVAGQSPRQRLDPPLSMILDEAANYPLPSLPSLMSDGGGTGISTMVVLQSLAQARAQWGLQEAAAIWDAAIAKVVLGGLGNADDLRDLAAVIGTREVERPNESRGPSGQTSITMSAHDVPILDSARLRTLPFGQAVLLLRASAPILLDLQPWTARRDAAAIAAEREAVEAAMGRGQSRT